MEDVLRPVTKPKRVSGDPIEVKTTPVVFEYEENSRLSNPRQLQAWASYINPRSKTFGNALQSALGAGYNWAYANTITTRPWWVGKVRRLRLLGKAEQVLDETLDMSDEVEMITSTGVRIGLKKKDAGLVKIKQDTAKFVAERLGKDEGYSSRSELTGAGGLPITIPDDKQKQVNEALLKFLGDK